MIGIAVESAAVDRTARVLEAWAAAEPETPDQGLTVKQFMRGKGGCRSASDFVSHLIAFNSITPQTGAFGPCGRTERNLSAILDTLSRSRGALSPAGP